MRGPPPPSHVYKSMYQGYLQDSGSYGLNRYDNTKYYCIDEIVKSFPQHIRLVGWLCLTSNRQRGHLETAPPFTVPCEGREAWFLHRSDR